MMSSPKNPLTFFSLLVIATAAAATMALASATPSFKQEMFGKLFSDGYFKKASCREIADFMLIRYGLPRIGAASPVTGIRLSTDRRNETSSPPQFTDSVLASERPYRSFRISTSGNGRDWKMTLDRELDSAQGQSARDRLRIRTTYRFKILDNDNRGSCAVESFDFQTLKGTASPAEASLMTLDTCLDLFSSGRLSSQGLKDDDFKIASFLREDCAIGMHYSLEAKKKLAIFPY